MVRVGAGAFTRRARLGGRHLRVSGGSRPPRPASETGCLRTLKKTQSRIKSPDSGERQYKSRTCVIIREGEVCKVI